MGLLLNVKLRSYEKPWLSAEARACLSAKARAFRLYKRGKTSRAAVVATAKSARCAVRKDQRARVQRSLVRVENALKANDQKEAFFVANQLAGRKQREKCKSAVGRSQRTELMRELQQVSDMFEKRITEERHVPAGCTTQEIGPREAPAGVWPECDPSLPEMHLFTDGSADPKDGTAGWGFVWQNEAGDWSQRCGRPSGEQTNNRGEMTALIKALELALKRENRVTPVIHADSELVCAGSRRLQSCISDARIPNHDLWLQIAALRLRSFFKVVWVKSHAGHEGNERADAAANEGRAKRLPTGRGRQPVTTTLWPVDDSVPSREEITDACSKVKVRAMGRDRLNVGIIKEAIDLLGRVKHASLKTEEQRSDKEKVVLQRDVSLENALMDAVVKICQQAWISGVAPEEWRQSKIIALPKPRKPGEQQDYRGITILSHIGKIMARITLQRLQVIPLLDVQYGFRPGRGTTMPIAIQKNVWQAACLAKQPMVSVFLDVTQAYDSVNREKIWTILQQAGVGTRMLRLLQSLYDDNVIVEWRGEVTSSAWQSSVGLRQGCLLSPLLFNIVLDTVFRSAMPLMKPFVVPTAEGPLDATLLAYADDMVINGFSTEDAQHNVRVLSEYLGDVGLVLSAKKTKAMRIPQEIVRPEGWKPETLASVTGTLRQQRGAKCAPHGEVTQATLRVDSTGRFFCWVPKGATNCACPFPHCLTRYNLGTTKGVEVLRKHVLQAHKEHAHFVSMPSARKCPACGGKHQGVCTACVEYVRVDPTAGNVTLYREAIEYVDNFRYLGVQLAADNRDTKDFDDRLKKARALFGALRRPLLSQRDIARKRRLQLFETIVNSVLFYAPLWILSAKQQQQLQTLQNEALRVITNFHGYLDAAVGHWMYPSAEELRRLCGATHIVELYNIRQQEEVSRIARRKEVLQSFHILWEKKRKGRSLAEATRPLLSSLQGTSASGDQEE